MNIEVKKNSVLQFEGDGIIVPTICTGQMITPIAAAVKERAGKAIEEQAQAHAPIAVGASLVTEGGNMENVRYLIHAPATEQPGMRLGVENIRRAVRAGLLGATRYEMETVAIPGFGYGESGVSHEETARAIIDEITGYKAPLPATAVLMDLNAEMQEAFSELVK